MTEPRQWEAVIGLEIHVQLATDSKLFSPAPTGYGAPPNSQVDWLDAGLPGTLPVLNGRAVEMAVLFALAVGGQIAPESRFARKNYFYPDLPKGYQISQYDAPIVTGGTLSVATGDGGERTVRLRRAHLEEDAGKSIHEGLRGRTGIDLNRAGVPLLEVVTEPDLRSAAEAARAMRKLHTLVRTLGICDGNLAEGSFRCDVNVSVRPRGESRLGTRVEIKNLNSFRFVERAVEYEIHRQVHRLSCGESVIQETRLYDAERNETRPMRGKEEAEDYRYFPEPDLPPLRVDAELIASQRSRLPELPDARRERLVALGVAPDDAVTLSDEPALAIYYDEVLAAGLDPRLAANWVLVELQGALRKRESTIEHSPVSAQRLAGLLEHIADGTISGKIAKQVFELMLDTQDDADKIIADRGLTQITDTGELAQTIDEILADKPEQVAQYRAGQQRVFNYFVGQVMAATRGRANPDAVRDILEQKLKQ